MFSFANITEGDIVEVTYEVEGRRHVTHQVGFFHSIDDGEVRLSMTATKDAVEFPNNWIMHDDVITVRKL